MEQRTPSGVAMFVFVCVYVMTGSNEIRCSRDKDVYLRRIFLNSEIGSVSVSDLMNIGKSRQLKHTSPLATKYSRLHTHIHTHKRGTVLICHVRRRCRSEQQLTVVSDCLFRGYSQ